MSLAQLLIPITQNIPADLKGRKIKYKLRYGGCTRKLFLRPSYGTIPAAVFANKIIFEFSYTERNNYSNWLILSLSSKTNVFEDKMTKY